MTEIPQTRNVIAVHGDGQLRRIEEPMPGLDPGTVLIQVKASLVSPGSELGGGWEALRERQLNPDDRAPRKIGYSNAGIVLRTGAGVDRFKPGDRVCCVGNNYAQHADYAVVPQNLVVLMPASVTYAQASYAMLLATGLQAVRRGKPEMGDYVAVAGLGLVGLLTARLFQLAGCRVSGWDMNEVRLEFALQLGIRNTVRVGDEDPAQRMREWTGGTGLDHGVVAIGGNVERAYDALMASMKVTPDGHAMGNLIVVGGAEFPYKKNLSNVNVVRSSRTGPGYHDKAWERGADYPPVHLRWHTRNNLEYCLELIAEGQVNVDALTTHTVPFVEVEAQTEAITREPEKVLGMVFTMGED
jgi:threonine dehydrogenase-like Zn-dependent dehydrogenase